MVDTLFVIESFEAADSRPRVGAFTVDGAVVHEASPSEVLEAARQLEGAEEREYRVPRNDMLPPGIYGLLPGRYLVIPLGIEGEEG